MGTQETRAVRAIKPGTVRRELQRMRTDWLPQPTIWIVGQKSFGVAVLEMLSGNPWLGLVVGVTAPKTDKLAAASARYGVYRGDALAPELLQHAEADLIINAHGHALITAECRSACTHGAIGYHPSLLPRHRGRSAVEWTVASRDPIAGGTIYQLDDGYDTGPVIAQDWCFVHPRWTASDLWRERLFPMGIDLLTDVLRRARYGRDFWPDRPAVPQDEEYATSEPPWSSGGGVKAVRSPFMSLAEAVRANDAAVQSLRDAMQGKQ